MHQRCLHNIAFTSVLSVTPCAYYPIFRKNLDLAWAQPDRELAFVILGQNTNEALKRTKASAVNHDWLLLGAVGVNVLKLEIVRQLEVKLDGTALPSGDAIQSSVARAQSALRSAQTSVLAVLA